MQSRAATTRLSRPQSTVRTVTIGSDVWMEGSQSQRWQAPGGKYRCGNNRRELVAIGEGSSGILGCLYGRQQVPSPPSTEVRFLPGPCPGNAQSCPACGGEPGSGPSLQPALADSARIPESGAAQAQRHPRLRRLSFFLLVASHHAAQNVRHRTTQSPRRKKKERGEGRYG